MLEQIAAILMDQGLVAITWAGQMSTRGELVKLYRQYYEGEHRMKLTSEMKKMMQITDSPMDRYNANYCEMVISSMADRLEVDTIEATEAVESDTKPGQTWVDDVLKANRFDGLQIDVREAVLRDGETFVMVQYDDNAKRVILAHELAWDGDCGVMVIKDRMGREIVAGVKVWYEGEFRRVNIYYRNSIAKYNEQMVEVTDPNTNETTQELKLKMMGDGPEDTTRDNEEPGVPIIQFTNKSKQGSSELVNVIPLQDSLNSTLISAVMNALLTAFSILFAKGFKPPAGLTPGMIIHAYIKDENDNPYFSDVRDEAEAAAALMDTYSLERIQPGEVGPLIDQCEFLIKQIGVVSFTPVPGLMGGDSQSGEALQERRV
ncbi:MAG: phage portal protein, partial [Anaerolineae bacterium]|nr:phage portal protein [Anaerolineae bacterium]